MSKGPLKEITFAYMVGNFLIISMSSGSCSICTSNATSKRCCGNASVSYLFPLDLLNGEGKTNGEVSVILDSLTRVFTDIQKNPNQIIGYLKPFQ